MIMKKIWILHNSLHGNSEQVANQMANGLIGDYDVSVDHIKNITPKLIAEQTPYGLIIAVRILAFRSDPEMRQFISELDKFMTQPISKIAYFATHALRWKKLFIKGMKKTLDKVDCVGEICPEFLELKVEKAEGPLIEGSDSKINAYVSNLSNFLNN
jgi:flavodoxin